MAGRVFHYTLGVKLLSIIASGVIQRAGAGVLKTERKAVWMTTSERWEPTATPGVWDATLQDSLWMPLPEVVSEFGPLVRIEVPSALSRKTWADHLREGGMDLRHADALADTARQRRSEPNDWRLSYRDVPTRACLSVEWSDDGSVWYALGTFNEHGALDCVDVEALERIKAAAQTAGGR